MSSTPATFYIFHGSDDLRLKEEVDKMRAQVGDSANAEMNISEFDGETTPAAEILNAAMSFPFLAERRLVIVKNLLTWITRKGAGESGKEAMERLLDTLPLLPEWARLVFVERQKLPDSHKILRLAREQSSAGAERVFNPPKDSSAWISRRVVETYNTQMDPRAAQALASVTGDDLRRADNELIKLVSYVDGLRPIRESDVELLTPYVAEATAFQLVDAIAEGRGRAAQDYLHRLLQEKDEDPFRIYGMIVRQFRLLLLAKEHLAQSGRMDGLAEALGTSSDFVVKKTVQQSRRFSLEELIDIYRLLQDYDLKMKTGQIRERLALDLFIAQLSG